MSEFMFRNLSVRLYPAGGDVRFCQDRFTQPVDPTIFNCPQACTMNPSIVQVCPDPSTRESYCVAVTNRFCDATSQVAQIDFLTNIILPANADIRAELGALRADLERKMAAVDARQREYEDAAKPKSVEQIDALKAQMLAAVAELDEQRAQLEGDGQAPAPE